MDPGSHHRTVQPADDGEHGCCARGPRSRAHGVAVLVVDLPAWVAAATWAIGGLGMGLSYSPTNLVVLTDAPPGTEGSATASVQLTDGLGTALGTGIGGAVLATAASAGWTRTAALAVVFAITTGVGAFAIVVARRFPRDPAPVAVGPVAVSRGSPLASAAA